MTLLTRPLLFDLIVDLVITSSDTYYVMFSNLMNREAEYEKNLTETAAEDSAIVARVKLTAQPI